MRKNEHRWRNSPTEIYRDIYKRARNKYTTALKKFKDSFLRSELVDPNMTAKRLWQLLAERTGNFLKCSRKTSEHLKNKEGLDRANLFADFFSAKVDDIVAQLKQFTIIDLPLQDPEMRTKSLLISFDQVSPAEASKLLERQPSSKNSADDLIPTSLLKKDKNFPLTLAQMCNTSFATANFPTTFKRALITPVPKKAVTDSSCPANYRPISNLTILSKLLEGFAASRLSNHLAKSQFLHPNQSAYRRYYSTETATTKVYSDWCNFVDTGQCVLVASLDVSAAFDTVNHHILLYRLKQAGVLGRAHKWLSSYLAHRTAVVKFGDARSTPFDLHCGVPQGSILGPLLFNIYMADLAHSLQLSCNRTNNKFGFHIYADDVLLYFACPPNDLNAVACLLSMELEKVETWMKANSLLLNVDKTTFFMLHGARGAIPSALPMVTVHGRSIPFQPSTNLSWLGVVFDRTLQMESFINKTSRTCFNILRMLRRIRPSINARTTSMLCSSLVCSRLDYCNALLSNANKTSLQKFQRVLNLAARITLRSPRKSIHVTPLLNELGWLSINKRITMKISKLVFKSLNLIAPSYLTDFLVVYVAQRPLRSSTAQELQLVLGTASRRVGRGSFAVAGPCVWNSLPVGMRHKDASLRTFYALLSDFMWEKMS
jgi:hypothetical protein